MPPDSWQPPVMYMDWNAALIVTNVLGTTVTRLQDRFGRTQLHETITSAYRTLAGHSGGVGFRYSHKILLSNIYSNELLRLGNVIDHSRSAYQ